MPSAFSSCYPAGTPLVALSALGDPDARSIVLGEGANRLDILVVRRAGALLGFFNSCPHQGTPLDTLNGRILDRRGRLVCSTHGARFELPSGACVLGPCKDDRLTPLPLRVEGGMVILDRTVRWEELK